MSTHFEPDILTKPFSKSCILHCCMPIAMSFQACFTTFSILWDKLSLIWWIRVMYTPRFVLCIHVSFTNPVFLALLLSVAKLLIFLKLVHRYYNIMVKQPTSISFTLSFSWLSNINMHFHVYNVICVYATLHCPNPVTVLSIMHLWTSKHNTVTINQVGNDPAFSTMPIKANSTRIQYWWTHYSISHLQHAQQSFGYYCWYHKQSFQLN